MAAAIKRLVQWVPVGGRYTRVSVMGFDLPDSFDNRAESFVSFQDHNVILMIPGEDNNSGISFVTCFSGNPGNERFYEYFGRCVLNNLATSRPDSKFLFFTVSHLNHVKLPAEFEASGGHKGNGGL
jgi:hypothetical protein